MGAASTAARHQHINGFALTKGMQQASRIQEEAEVSGYGGEEGSTDSDGRDGMGMFWLPVFSLEDTGTFKGGGVSSLGACS